MQNRCELYSDGLSNFRRIQISEDSVFNVTSGYCHQPDLTKLVDFNPPDPISTTWYGSEDKGKHFFLINPRDSNGISKLPPIQLILPYIP